jgi:hypothetical protein
MRTLTLEEIELVAGGDTKDFDPIPVTADPPTDDPDPGLPGSPGQGGGGGGGGGSVPISTTHEGHQYFFDPSVHLSNSQIEMINKIVDYGIDHGVDNWKINSAVALAFDESSLGSIENNPTHFGLYQYNTDTWSFLGHGNLNIHSEDDQIHAMFDDITRFGDQWRTDILSGKTDLSEEDYVELRHHAGPYSTDWNSPYISEYNAKANQLDFWVD